MSTVFQWLIERGQPEGEECAVWLENSLAHPARDKCWTATADEAAMFPTRETAEAYIAEQGLEARAVEHGFMAPQEPEPMDSRERKLHYLLARVIANPRWLSIGSHENTAELRISRNLYEDAMATLRRDADSQARPEGPSADTREQP